jgi:hypothetical protein
MNDFLIASLDFALGLATLYYAWNKLTFAKRSKSIVKSVD